MTVRSSKQGTGLAMRIVLVLLAVTLAALWGMYPQMQSEVVNWNDDKLKTETIAAGDTLVQPVTMDATFGVKVLVLFVQVTAYMTAH